MSPLRLPLVEVVRVTDYTADLAAAWDGGYRAAIEDYGCDIPWGGMTSDENPYRQKTTDAPSNYDTGPGCKVCDRRVMWREGQGWCHARDDDGPLVYYPHNDPFGHEAVASWGATPVLPAVAVGPSATGANALLLTSAFWHAYDDTAEALAVLTRMACPAPCVGVVNETGWHLECERKAREALAILRSWHYPDDEPPATDSHASVSPEQTPSPAADSAHSSD